MDSAGLTGPGKVLITILVIIMIGAGIYFGRSYLLPEGKDSKKEVDIAAYQQKMSVNVEGENKSPSGVTTQDSYEYIPSQKLPPVKGVSAYKWDPKDPVVVFPINVWSGWLPIIAANCGSEPNEESIFFKKFGFKVKLMLIDDPVTARDTYASGQSHCLWGTLDMIALFAPGLMADSRTAPRVFQQIDWSSGGDGIVVRDTIKTVDDLKNKTVVYAENSPSQYYFSTLLLSGGVQPNRVSHKHTKSAFEASAAFVADQNIDACISWAPDIYNIVDSVSGTRLLSTTAEASKVITDVYAVRADFARDHPEIVKGLVSGIFMAMEKMGNEEYKKKACKWMAEFYKFPVDEIEKMIPDAHSTNFAENKKFFLEPNNPVGFQKTWDRIQFVYGELGKLEKSIPFDQVMDFSVIKGLAAEGAFPDQKDTYSASFSGDETGMLAEAPILKNTIRINFYPNSSNPRELARDELGQIIPGKLYDPNIDKMLESVAQLASQFDRCVVKVVGHCDSSMKGKVPEEGAIFLSKDRANSIVKEIVKKYGLPENKFVSEGQGWNVPFDPNDPLNQELNRRVEINVYKIEG